MALTRNPVENLIRRRLRNYHINREPFEIQLIRPTLIKTDTGGLKQGEEVTLPPVTVRLIPFKKRQVVITKNKPEGDIINLPYVLVAPVDTDIQVGDHFWWEGGHYKVFSFEPNRSYRISANITYFGRQVPDKWSG